MVADALAGWGCSSTPTIVIVELLNDRLVISSGYLWTIFGWCSFHQLDLIGSWICLFVGCLAAHVRSWTPKQLHPIGKSSLEQLRFGVSPAFSRLNGTDVFAVAQLLVSPNFSVSWHSSGARCGPNGSSTRAPASVAGSNGKPRRVG